MQTWLRIHWVTCMISVSGLWLCLRDTVLVFNYQLKSGLRGSCVGSYMHGVMRIGKTVNAKVMKYDLRDLGQAGQMTCYHCRQPGHMRRDCPRRQRSYGIEIERSD